MKEVRTVHLVVIITVVCSTNVRFPYLEATTSTTSVTECAAAEGRERFVLVTLMCISKVLLYCLCVPVCSVLLFPYGIVEN